MLSRSVRSFCSGSDGLALSPQSEPLGCIVGSRRGDEAPCCPAGWIWERACHDVSEASGLTLQSASMPSSRIGVAADIQNRVGQGPGCTHVRHSSRLDGAMVGPGVESGAATGEWPDPASLQSELPAVGHFVRISYHLVPSVRSGRRGADAGADGLPGDCSPAVFGPSREPATPDPTKGKRYRLDCRATPLGRHHRTTRVFEISGDSSRDSTAYSD